MTKANVVETLSRNRGMRVRDIQVSILLTPVRAVYSVVQYTVLPRNGNTDVMSDVDQMVIFYLMTKRRINLVRLILDFIITTIDAEKKKHASLPYGMFLTKVFNKAQLPQVAERSNDKRPTTIMKTFQAMGLKPKAQDKEKENERKKRRKMLLLLRLWCLALRNPNPSLLIRVRKRRRRQVRKEVSLLFLRKAKEDF